jgi:hypothetical protein
VIVLWFLVAFLIGGIIFGCSTLLQSFFNKSKRFKWLISYSFPICSIIPVVVLFLVTPREVTVLNFSGFLDLTNFALFILAFLVPALIITFKAKKLTNVSKGVVVNEFISGAAMEIPQRLFMQTFFVVILSVYHINHGEVIAIFLNALIWCLFILTQAIILKQKFNAQFMIEEVTSFIFSVIVGFLFMRSNLILYPMLAHGMERIISILLVKIKFKYVN